MRTDKIFSFCVFLRAIILYKALTNPQFIKNSKKTPYQIYVVRACRSVGKGLKGSKFNPQNPVKTKQTKKIHPTLGVLVLWDWGGGARTPPPPDSLGSCSNLLMEH